LNTDNDEIGPWIGQYQPEAFEPSGPGFFFNKKKWWFGIHKLARQLHQERTQMEVQ